MASYNAVNKIPDTVSPFIRDIVEKEWKFDGMVCTDAGSLPNLTRQFHYYPDPTAAVVGSVKAGISVFLDQYATPLRDALDKKLLTEADMERNIRGNIRMRMRLGEFDPPEMSPYNNISGTEEPWYGEKNKALARKVTQESIVLLKNSDNLLPLDKSKLRSIAVIGPYGDNVLVDWYAGIPPYTVTPLEASGTRWGRTSVCVICRTITTATPPTWRPSPTSRSCSWAIIPHATAHSAGARCRMKARKR
jgi:beta-glucosidase